MRKPTGEGLRGPPESTSPEERLERLRRYHAARERVFLRDAETLTKEGLRRRRDGQPSAAQPASTLPVKLWATILDPPDGSTWGSFESKLMAYRYWLQRWKTLGLYDGPTILTVVNPEPKEEDDADPA